MRHFVQCLLLVLSVYSAGGVDDFALTPRDTQLIVDTHNAMRRRVSATDMKHMEWHKGLATKSLELTEECIWTRTPRDKLKGVVRGFDQLSQNLHVTGVLTDIESVVKGWAEEGNNYRYDTDQCNKMCWRYTQVVWANTHAVGCSVRYCPSIQNVVWGKHGGFFLSCLYGPGGNEEGLRPYMRGDSPCANCSQAFPYCVAGLCSRLDLTTTSTTTQTTPDEQEPRTSTAKPSKTTVSVGSSNSLLPLHVGYLLTICFILNIELLVTPTTSR